MSFLDMDERLLPLLELVEFDRSPLTDIKSIGHCDIGLIEGGLCNAENVQVLREYRSHCKVLVAMGACAINGGLPAQRNQRDVGQILRDVYCRQAGGSAGVTARLACQNIHHVWEAPDAQSGQHVRAPVYGKARSHGYP